MNPLLSIIIATKNRENYCIKVIESILSIDSDLIELAIADNSDSSIIKEYVQLNPSSRLIYNYNPSPISSIDNFNNAMNMATGEYICMIGDDDTILPNIIDLTIWAKQNDIDSISTYDTIAYYWPNALNQFPEGALFMTPFKPQIKKVDAKEALNLIVKNGFVHYDSYNGPKTYHGIVRRKLMLEIKDKTGNFYGGLSPDIYSTVALSCFVQNHISITTPFTIAGVCAKSSSAASIGGRHSGNLKDAPHFKNRTNYTWDESIPDYYSISTIWGESGLKALKDLKQEELYCKINFYKLLAQGIFINMRTILKLVLQKTEKWRKRNKLNFYYFWMKILLEFFLLFLTKIKTVLQNRLFRKKRLFTPVKTIDIARSIAIEFISKQK